MRFTTFLAALVAIVASVAASCNVTSSTQDYFLLSQRQLQNEIALSESNIAGVDDRAADNIKLITEQQRVVLQEIQQVDRNLVALQALSEIRKHCVQLYKPLLVTSDAAQKQFTACLTTAQNRLSSVTSTAKTALNSAKTAANTNLPKAIATCNTTHANNETQREACVLLNVETYTNTVNTHLNNVNKQLETGICTAGDLSRDAIQCSFVIEKNTLVTIGSVLELIDNCITEKQSDCPCANPNSTSIESETSLRDLIMGVNN